MIPIVKGEMPRTLQGPGGRGCLWAPLGWESRKTGSRRPKSGKPEVGSQKAGSRVLATSASWKTGKLVAIKGLAWMIN